MGFFWRFVVKEFVKTCDEHVPGRRLKGVDAGLAIVKAGAASVSVVIKQSAHHASVTTFRGQMQGCQAGMRLSVNCGSWNRNKSKKLVKKFVKTLGMIFFAIKGWGSRRFGCDQAKRTPR